MDPDSGVILARTAEGAAVALGLLRCGRLWLCPVCSAKIRDGRAKEVSEAAVKWIGMGGTVLFVTFTARHAAAHHLGDLMDAIQGTRADAAKGTKRQPGAYQRLITGAAWAGDRRKVGNKDGIRGRVGFVGMVRATEVTIGQENGWHPHIHALVFVGGRTTGERAEKRVTGTFEPSASALAELEAHWRAVWTRHLAKVDPQFKPSDEHGVKFEALDVTKSPDAVAKYLAKLQEGKDAGAELARGDMKTGRFGNMTPFEMLGRIGDLTSGLAESEVGGHGDLSWCLARWGEYETATKGRRAIEWTRYLRQLLGIEGGDSEDDDMDLLFQADAASEFRSGVRVTTEAWHQVTGRALDLAVTEAVEADRPDEVVALVVAVGGSADAVQVMTPGEVEAAWQATLAKLAERREAAAVRRAVARA
jgi:hypothetical protein